MLRAIVSPFKNPYLNLALEDYFLRGGADLPVVFFYVNRPCVVFGRFQNPWLESHLPYLVQQDIWPVRRQSGGGCVFHDEGNLNFSYITSEAKLDRQHFSLLLQRAFATAHIELTISPRNDLWLGGRKISGSAYKQTKDGSFHHGTFLVNSDLSKLEESLKHTIIPKHTKSIASVRSKVVSLQEFFPHVEISDVIEIISNELKTTPLEIDGSLLSQPAVQSAFRELISWDWLWGETPHFELAEGITVRKGELQEPLNGRFSFDNLKGHLSEERLNTLFPDFSEQHRSSNLIF
jgi:lipoate-protein ligase A